MSDRTKRACVIGALLTGTLLVLSGWTIGTGAATSSPIPSAAYSTQLNTYAELRAEGERLHAEGSFERARRIYERAAELELSAAESRWVGFRIADSAWRALSATRGSDRAELDSARRRLEALVTDVPEPGPRDATRIAVLESLGDFWWTRRDVHDWNQAWPHYEEALQSWASSTNLEVARDRYLDLVWRLTRYFEPSYSTYPNYGYQLQQEIFENAVRIARSAEDRAHSRYLLARRLMQSGSGWEQLQRVPEELEGVIDLGRTTDWYDDALYQLALWLSQRGRPVQRASGEYQAVPDYEGALALFSRLRSELGEGETAFYDDAGRQIEQITMPSLDLSVDSFFLPGSELRARLQWRNIDSVELAVYRTQLAQDVRGTERRDWLHSISVDGKEPLETRRLDLAEDVEPNAPGLRDLLLDRREIGAYVVVARAGDLSSRALVLVTDASLAVKTSEGQALVYFGDSVDGSPIANAAVGGWMRHYTNGWRWRRVQGRTSEQGLAILELGTTSRSSAQLFVAASDGDRQAFVRTRAQLQQDDDGEWRIYAFTDRPTYRPEDTVQWKIVARRMIDRVYETPGDRDVEYEIRDPRGTEIASGTVELNGFGSAWDELALSSELPLGQYMVQFFVDSSSGRRSVGSAALFRLEEYKLPEFVVSVQTPEVDGAPVTHRLGDDVAIEIQADYLFGAPVAGATVEVVVEQSSFNLYIPRPRRYAWYYDEARTRYDYGGGQVVERRTLTTDAAGKARFTLRTPGWSQGDLSFRVEARVTDASRREVTGSDTVRVTRQSYGIAVRAEHHLYQPGDSVVVELEARDANNNPVAASGTVQVTRQRWRDNGYDSEQVVSRAVSIDASGRGELRFDAADDGYYRIAWIGPDAGAPPVTAKTYIWSARAGTAEVGYRHGGLEIILDKDTLVAGEMATVMIAVPTSGRHVLFSVESETLHHYELVHVTGTVKLLRFPVSEEHVPSVWLDALMFSDSEVFRDSERVVVPPEKQFLTVEVEADREQYLPGDTATLNVRALNSQGEPVSAEVALGLIDEAVYSIQGDLAGDVRRFFYGSRGRRLVTTAGSNEQSRLESFELRDGDLVRERDGLAFAKSGDDSGSFRADLESNVAQERMSVDAISGGARRGALAQPQAMADMRAVGSVLES